MFRLLKSGLPEDPVYPADLKELGYFINVEDEVRMTTNPRAYFNFFLTKNDRHNAVQREAMNTCLREEVLTRLHDLGLETVCLPLGAEVTEPHIPILVSSNISKKKSVIILFYEHTQDLGVFAYRIIGGRGGINQGSAVNFVKHIQSFSGTNSEDSPGIILANLGQLRWWRCGKKAVTHATWFSLPQKSAVSGAHRFDITKNTVLNNRNTSEHVAYVFNHVVQDLLAPDAMLEVIGVSAGAVEVVDFLNKPRNWEIMEPRMTALALVATFHQRDDINNPWFAAWLRKRARAYIISTKPASTPLAPSDGNAYTNPDDNNTTVSDCYGCPVYSLGEPYYSELMLPKGYEIVLDWFQEVVAGGEDYENPEVVIEQVVQREEQTEEEIKWEENDNVEVKGEGVKSEELKGEDGKVEKVKREQVNFEYPKTEEARVEELNIEGIKVEDLKIDELKEEEIQEENMNEEKARSLEGLKVIEEAMKDYDLNAGDLPATVIATDQEILEFKVEKSGFEDSKEKEKETKVDEVKVKEISKIETKQVEKQNVMPEEITEQLKKRGSVIHFGGPGADDEQ